MASEAEMNLSLLKTIFFSINIFWEKIWNLIYFKQHCDLNVYLKSKWNIPLNVVDFNYWIDDISWKTCNVYSDHLF